MKLVDRIKSLAEGVIIKKAVRQGKVVTVRTCDADHHMVGGVCKPNTAAWLKKQKKAAKKRKKALRRKPAVVAKAMKKRARSLKKAIHN